MLDKFQIALEQLYSLLPDDGAMKQHIKATLDDPNFSNKDLVYNAMQTLQFVTFILHARQYTLKEVLERQLELVNNAIKEASQKGE